MKNLTPKYIVFVIIFPIIYILSSCHHKYICPECESGNRIIFEWEKIEKNLSDLSAEAKSDDISFKDFIGTFSPSHMRVIFYNLDGDLIYNFVLPESGGYADIDPDEYIVACYNVNNSNVEWINIDNPYKLQCTLKTTNLNEYEMSSDNINTQSKFLMPNLVYGSMVFHLNVTKDSDIILVPLLLVDLYTYEIVGIDNAECIKSITASLSGLRKTIFLSGLSKSDTYGIIPFTYNTISPQNDAITHRFYQERSY